MKKYNYTLFTIFFIVFSGSIFSCSDKAPQKKKKLLIVTTTGMIADAVKNIADTSADVVALMGPGVDPHLYKATHGDLEKLSEADIIFYNGLHLEGKMAEILEKLAKTKPVIPVSNGIPHNLLMTAPQFANAFDPHIWFDVHLWTKSVAEIYNNLTRINNSKKDYYEHNAAKYLKQLDSLDKWVKHEIQSIPQERRVLITAHDAFGYFGKAYAIEVKGLQGISTSSDFGLNDITGLVNFIVSRKIKAVFVESSVSPKAIEAVVKGVKEKGHEISIGGTLYSDAMGAQGTFEGTYIGMVTSNVQKITFALK
ncbi:metal ABC transporter solute-binding protein, Zn/Mn family [Sporocytophaga myxococcoides]|nr:zinc ABC transporter substrate-binding protein [Sporocytophaga myxococcoides]